MLREDEQRFQARGPCRTRDGKAQTAGVNYSHKKLCLVATDKAFLVALLLELCERPQCHFVNYSCEPKDGM